MLQTLGNIQKMSPENFCYWLQGLFELQPDLKQLTSEQVEMIRQHLKYVFQGKNVDQQTFFPQFPITTPVFPGVPSTAPFVPPTTIPYTVVC